MQPLSLSEVSSADLAALDQLYHSMREVWIRTRVKLHPGMALPHLP